MQTVVPQIMMIIAVALPIALLLVLLITGLFGRRSPEGRVRTRHRTAWLLAGGVLGAIWCLHFSVGYFAIATAGEGVSKLSVFEEAGNSLLRTVKAFGLEEEMDEFILDGKEMVAALYGADNWRIAAFGSYACILFLAAPIIGGIGLLEILAGIFPKLQLWFSRFAWWKDRYYFSQLHDGSLALARSICRVEQKGLKGRLRKPILVFAGVEIDKGNADTVQRLEEAKALGAICLQTDLQYIKKSRSGRRKYFLIQEDETKALQQLADLAKEKNCRPFADAEVFFFVTSDAYVPLEKNIREELRARLGEKAPLLEPVSCNFNLVTNLLVDIPLYEPLLKKEKKPDGTKDLVVTILGAGGLGTEMFLATYWFGQILDCNLKIRVYDQATEEEFWSRIDRVNPEIRKTTRENDPILRINRRGDMANPYCQVTYCRCELHTSRLAGILSKEKEDFLNTDYFFVALGSDRENITIANEIRRCVGEHHVAQQDDSATVITYVVRDAQMSQSLNRKKYSYFLGPQADIYMRAVGSLEEVYDIHTVFMPEHDRYAQEAYDAYRMMTDKSKRTKLHSKRIKDDYDYWANLARIMHASYKMYSMGLLKTSLFDSDNEEEFREKRNAECQRGREILGGRFPSDYTAGEAHKQLMNRLAWLEHRRWNAFTRVKGYRSTMLYDKYWKLTNHQKHVDLRLHPCLVECDDKGIRAAWRDDYTIDQQTQFRCTDESDFDLLDELSYKLHKEYGLSYDFKLYDYVYHDF